MRVFRWYPLYDRFSTAPIPPPPESPAVVLIAPTATLRLDRGRARADRRGACDGEDPLPEISVEEDLAG